MPLYRARPQDGTAWITGASTGIGRALALSLAARGYTVAATARGGEKLDDLAAEARGGPGRILPFPCDVTDEAAIRATVDAIEAELGPIALAVFNAGTYVPAPGERLQTETFVKTYQLNVLGVVFALVPVVEAMKRRGRGQIAIVGSVSSYVGLPLASAYGASKAALNNMAAALKFDLDKMNIRIQMINPGFVRTPLTDKNSFPMPALMEADAAAARIVEGLASGGFEITFPRRLSWPLKLLGMLPFGLRFAILGRATGWRDRPLRP